MLPLPLVMSPVLICFCQRTFPVFRSRQNRSRFFSASGLETKMESPHTAGVAPLGPGRGAAHLTVSLVQVVGNPISVEVPLKAGPRHCGQFSAWASEVARTAAARIWRVFIRWRG